MKKTVPDQAVINEFMDSLVRVILKEYSHRNRQRLPFFTGNDDEGQPYLVEQVSDPAPYGSTPARTSWSGRVNSGLLLSEHSSSDDTTDNNNRHF